MLVIPAHEVHDGLLLGIGIEINDGPLANFLNMTLFSVSKKRDSFTFDFVFMAGFCKDYGQGRSRWRANGTNAPARLSGAPQGLLARRCRAVIGNFLGIHTRPNLANLALLQC